MRKEPEIVKILKQEEMNKLSSQTSAEQMEFFEKKDESLSERDNIFFDNEKNNQLSGEQNDTISFTELTYKHLVENSPDSIIIVKKSGVISFFNKTSEKITGYSKSEIIGKNFKKLKILKKKDIKKLLKLFNGSNTGRKTDRFEIEVMHKNGNTQLCKIHITEIKSNQKTKGYMVIFRDITKKKESDKRLKEIEERYRSLFQESLDWVYICDFKGNFLDANPAALKGMGYTKKELRKMNFASILEKGQLIKALRETQKIKKIGTQNEFLEYKVKRKDGSIAYLETMASLLYKDGKPYAVQGIARDITNKKKSEEALKESEERYRALFESINDGIIIADIKTHQFKYVNPAICKLLGYKEKELLKMKLQDIHPDYFLNDAKKGFINQSKKNKFISENAPLLKKNGSVIYADVSATNVTIKGNLFNVGIFRDVTDRLKREADLIKFSRVIEQSQTSVIITDEKGDIEYVNPKFEEVSGYSKGELIGKNTSILNSGKTNKKTYEKLWEFISSGETWKGELLNKKKNGELYWENVIITPIKNPEGKITNFVASKEDITEQKKTQEEMKLKDYAMRSSINAIVIANSVGNISYVNPSFLKMWGYYNDREVVGKPIVKFWQMKGQYMKVMDSMVNKGGWVGELTAERSDGTTFPVQLSANLVKDENGEMKYMMASFVDITKQKEAEEKLLENQERIEAQNIKLKKLDELKSTFLNVTSHELRTPMASIKGYIQMIIKQTLGNTSDEQNKALNVVLRNVERLDHLIQDILDISRLESGTMKFIPENTDISKMLEEIAETMNSSAETKQIKIKTQIDKDLPELFIDQDRVKQVIINFINNAIKFSEPNTSITIKASKENENILFEVEDQGRGIPKDKISKVFDTFYQVDSGMDRKFGGAGLGLAISRGIVLSHGGKIWVESKEGEGSTFKFTLPIESVKDIEDKFREVDVFRLKEQEVKEEYDKYKKRMKI